MLDRVEDDLLIVFPSYTHASISDRRGRPQFKMDCDDVLPFFSESCYVVDYGRDVVIISLFLSWCFPSAAQSDHFVLSGSVLFVLPPSLQHSTPS